MLPIYSPPPQTPSTASSFSSTSSSSPRTIRLLSNPPGYSSIERFKRKTRPRNRFRSSHLIFLLVLAIILLPLLITRHSPHYIQFYYTASAAGRSFSSTSNVDIGAHIPPATGGLPEHLDIPLTLEARLSYLLSRPALSHEDAALSSRHGCPLQTYSRNTHEFHVGKTDIWEQVGPSEIRQYRSKLVNYLRRVERAGHPLVWEEPTESTVSAGMRRGIIFTAKSMVSHASSSACLSSPWPSHILPWLPIPNVRPTHADSTSRSEPHTVHC